MAAFTNIVANADGVPLAGFLSSLDARAYAENQSLYGDLTVTDWLGFVTEHRFHKPVRIIQEPDASHDEATVREALKNITDNFAIERHADQAAELSNMEGR